MGQPSNVDRLAGWASIGGYIGRDARTAQRYERERALPIRRMPGAGRSTVFALRAELDSWLLHHGVEQVDRVTAADAASPTPASPAPARRNLSRAALTPIGLGLLGMGVAIGAWLGMSRTPPAPPHPLGAFDQRGAAALSERAPAGLTRAIDDYTQAIVRNPADTSAYVGLADSYNLAPEVIGTPPAEAYPRAQAAAERALQLSPASAEAHRALAFTLFWWGEDAQRAEVEFRRALSLDPLSALTHQWFANALAARGDRRALGEIDRALALSATPAAMIDKGWILSVFGRQAEAEPILKEVVQLQPDSACAHMQLAYAMHRSGDTAGELEESRRAAELRHDDAEVALLSQAQGVLNSRGRIALVTFLGDHRAALARAGRGRDFLAALAASDLRRRDDALRFLAAAKLARDSAMMGLRTNPDFAWLRGDPQFEALAP